MNERIYDLALEVLKDYPTLESWTFTRSELEKFAELIVRECAERLLHDVKLTDIQTTRCVASIKEHFGVEE